MNVGNCFIIKFNNGTRLVDYRYFVNGIRVTEQRSLKDLGAIRNSHLKFREHIDYMTPRLLIVMLYLYRSLVMPILMHASPVSSPHYGVDHDVFRGVDIDIARKDSTQVFTIFVV